MSGKTKEEIYKEVYIKMMMKYGDDPFYKEVLDGLFEGESSTKTVSYTHLRAPET